MDEDKSTNIEVSTPDTAAPAVPAANLTDVNVDGYSFKFDPEIIDDVEVIRMVGEIENGKVARVIDFLKFLLGENGFSDMENFFKTRDGKFKLTVMMKAFDAIFKEFDPKG